MKKDNIFTAIFMATLVNVKVYPKGNHYYVELELKGNFEDYPPLQQLVITRGKRKGKIILKLQTYDYTGEHKNRKVEWKLASSRKTSSGKNHVSKVYPIAPDKAWIDFGTLGRPDDIGLILFDECLEYGKIKTMKIFIVENGRNDPGLIQMFKDQAFS